MDNKTKIKNTKRSCIKWAVFGLVLFIIGFVSDGHLLDSGHHAVFILSGVAVGVGISQ